MAKFKIFTDSCCDLSTEVRKKYDIEYAHMGVVLDGKDLPADLDWELYKPEEFYGWLKSGRKVKTTQVFVPEFFDRFRPVLERGFDILYIACSSKLSGSYGTCQTLVIPQLKEEFPDRKIIAIDSLNASCSQGMIAIKASLLREEGKSMEEVANWVEENKLCFHFFATVDTLTYLKNAGRIKGAKAFFGNIMGVKPIITNDAKGHNAVYKKARGTKQSIEELVAAFREVYLEDKNEEIIVGHGNAPERVELLKKKLEEEFGRKVTTMWIGPIVGTSCGPGIIAAFCIGKETTFEEGEDK